MFKKLVNSIKDAINPPRYLVNQPSNASQTAYRPNQTDLSRREQNATISSASNTKVIRTKVTRLDSFDFPAVDDKGMKLLRVLDNVRLSGVTKKHEGINPQDTIELLSIGEEVFFKRITMKKYPNATLVVDSDDNPIGWIPEDFSYQEDIAKRLDDGTTVKGLVNDILGGENGKSYGVTIDIARYEKKRISKAKSNSSSLKG